MDAGVFGFLVGVEAFGAAFAVESWLRLGADHFYATRDPETFVQLAGEFELILNTVGAPVDVDAYLSLRAYDGALVNLGAPAERLSRDVFSRLRGRRSYAGSIIGGTGDTRNARLLR